MGATSTGSRASWTALLPTQVRYEGGRPAPRGPRIISTPAIPAAPPRPDGVNPVPVATTPCQYSCDSRPGATPMPRTPRMAFSSSSRRTLFRNAMQQHNRQQQHTQKIIMAPKILYSIIRVESSLLVPVSTSLLLFCTRVEVFG